MPKLTSAERRQQFRNEHRKARFHFSSQNSSSTSSIKNKMEQSTAATHLTQSKSKLTSQLSNSHHDTSISFWKQFSPDKSAKHPNISESAVPEQSTLYFNIFNDTYAITGFSPTDINAYGCNISNVHDGNLFDNSEDLIFSGCDNSIYRTGNTSKNITKDLRCVQNKLPSLYCWMPVAIAGGFLGTLGLCYLTYKCCVRRNTQETRDNYYHSLNH